jgi:hypothetical protein
MLKFWQRSFSYNKRQIKNEKGKRNFDGNNRNELPFPLWDQVPLHC